MLLRLVSLFLLQVLKIRRESVLRLSPLLAQLAPRKLSLKNLLRLW